MTVSSVSRSLSTEQLNAFRRAWKTRRARRLTPSQERALQRARNAATALAKVLITEHGAKRVILFGSVARRRPLRADSDIDLAVEGLAKEAYYRLVADGLTADKRVVDLIAIESARETLRKVIELEGSVIADAGN